MIINWKTKQVNPDFLKRLGDLPHFKNHYQVVEDQRPLHCLLKPNTTQWFDYNNDEDCLEGMIHFYNQFVKPDQLKPSIGGFLGIGKPGCPYSIAAHDLLTKELDSYYEYHYPIPGYHGTYPLIFWFGERLRYIGGYTTFVEKLPEQYIRRLLLRLQRCLPPSTQKLHHQPTIVMTRDKKLKIDNGVRLLIPEKPHEYFTIEKEFNLPTDGWIIDLRNVKKVRIQPL